ncbi:hypothetical protein H5410_055189 [Solanum commersonii]|uniref:5'-nucleotidase n=1 Tax=Solanum commersonii TaxID=4109 RepID=A0A9J5WIC1_SOLCO|nr:hypothetical protein H5410_055189 [Solanum commersonii]
MQEKGVPVLIFSAGLADIIEEVLKQKVHRSFKNVRVVSNRMVFDENGHLQSFKGITYHHLEVLFTLESASSSFHGWLGSLCVYLRRLPNFSYTSKVLELATGCKTIHVLNKNEHALDMAAPLHDHFDDVNGLSDEKSALKKRTNVLLLGDHIGDLGMSDGLDYETRISVGFLNDRVEDSLESYRKAFDILYLNDSSMHGVLKLATHLCSTESD